MESQGLIQAASYVGNSSAIAVKAYSAVSQFSGWAVTSVKDVTSAIGSQIASNLSNACKTTSTVVSNGRTITTTTSLLDKLKAASSYITPPPAVQSVMFGLSVAMPFLTPMAGAIKNHICSNRDLSRQQNQFQEFKATGRALNPSEVENHIALADELTSDLTSKANEYHKLANRNICSWSGVKKFIGVNIPLLFLAPELGMVAVGCFIVASAGAHILSRMYSTDSFTSTAQKLESMAEETQQSVAAIKNLHQENEHLHQENEHLHQKNEHLHQENEKLLDNTDIAIETAVSDIIDLQNKQDYLMEDLDEMTKERTRLLEEKQAHAREIDELKRVLRSTMEELQQMRAERDADTPHKMKRAFSFDATNLRSPFLITDNDDADDDDADGTGSHSDGEQEVFVDESVLTDTDEAQSARHEDGVTASIQEKVASTPWLGTRVVRVFKDYFDFTIPEGTFD